MAKKKKVPLTKHQGCFVIAGMRANLEKNIQPLCKERHQHIKLNDTKKALGILQDSLKE